MLRSQGLRVEKSRVECWDVKNPVDQLSSVAIFCWTRVEKCSSLRLSVPIKSGRVSSVECSDKKGTRSRVFGKMDAGSSVAKTSGQGLRKPVVKG